MAQAGEPAVNVSEDDESDKEAAMVQVKPLDVCGRDNRLLLRQEKRIFEENQDNELKALGLYEEGMTVDQKRELLCVIAASKETAEEEERKRKESRQCGSSDFFEVDQEKSFPRIKEQGRFSCFHTLSNSPDGSTLSPDSDARINNICLDCVDRTTEPYSFENDEVNHPSQGSQDLFSSQSERGNQLLEENQGNRQLGQTILEEKLKSSRVSSLELQKLRQGIEKNDNSQSSGASDETEPFVNSPSLSLEAASPQSKLLMENNIQVWPPSPEAVPPLQCRKRRAESFSLYTVPYFCPPNCDPVQHTQQILQAMESYYHHLAKVQRFSLFHRPWGQPICVGRHLPGTLDLYKRKGVSQGEDDNKSIPKPLKKRFIAESDDDEHSEELPSLQVDCQTVIDSREDTSFLALKRKLRSSTNSVVITAENCDENLTHDNHLVNYRNKTVKNRTSIMSEEAPPKQTSQQLSRKKKGDVDGNGEEWLEASKKPKASQMSKGPRKSKLNVEKEKYIRQKKIGKLESLEIICEINNDLETNEKLNSCLDPEVNMVQKEENKVLCDNLCIPSSTQGSGLGKNINEVLLTSLDKKSKTFEIQHLSPNILENPSHEPTSFVESESERLVIPESPPEEKPHSTKKKIQLSIDKNKTANTSYNESTVLLPQIKHSFDKVSVPVVTNNSVFKKEAHSESAIEDEQVFCISKSPFDNLLGEGEENTRK
ncbi:uncharacterized protein LOC106459384 [Limulus polyphemus]|uniref:Uncharacterized protein LOC106459384 n=1 Tax=Limulus polyphemus TaxID=6850 RepID=A0ABM1B465_LIMPO|nr:uncharacterized protein LOC106459384 [Limulus polyphemus]XP_022241561.1 uncharacterized protein LOC106459384 [Limulus polyphemus]